MASKETSLTLDRVKECLSYDSQTGIFVWRGERGGRAKAGKIAGTFNKGHRVLTIDGVKVQAHRVAWLYVTGAWPVSEIDHINRVKGDNRFCNLREASRCQNMVNKTKPKKDGLPRGVRKSKCLAERYYAQIAFEKKHYYLGSFSTAGEARAAYAAAAARLHGAFAQ